MDLNKFMREIRPRIRPVEIGTCPFCGREKKELNKLLGSKAIPRCISCWQEYDEAVPAQPAAVRPPAPPQPDLEARLSELEGRVVGLETTVNNLVNSMRRRR